MSKSLYIFLLIAFALHGWNLAIVPHLTATMWMVVQILFWAWGWFHWGRKNEINLVQGNLTPFFWIVIGIILSTIPAYIFYEQSFITSIIAYRRQYFWLLIPVLLRVAPSEDDMIKALKSVVIIMWGVLLLRMFWPDALRIDEDQLTKYQETGYFGYVYGFPIALIPYFYSIDRFMQEGLRNKNNIIWIIVCFTFFIAMENRSVLFSAALVSFLFLIKHRGGNKPIIILVAILSIIVLLYTTAGIWMRLYYETQTNLSNDEYNRNIALNYFIYDSNTHWLNYILGNGYISSHTSSLVEELQEMGIYNSDVGFVGFWNEYGILPIIAFIYVSAIGLFRKQMPNYTKMQALSILICSLTISYFGLVNNALVFFFLYYQVYYYSNQSAIDGEYYDDCVKALENDKVSNYSN